MGSEMCIRDSSRSVGADQSETIAGIQGKRDIPKGLDDGTVVGVSPEAGRGLSKYGLLQGAAVAMIEWKINRDIGCCEICHCVQTQNAIRPRVRVKATHEKRIRIPEMISALIQVVAGNGVPKRGALRISNI